MIKKNQLILLSLLGAMAIPLTIQPLYASAAQLQLKALTEKKAADEKARMDAEAKAKAEDEKKLAPVVAKQNETVASELNTLIGEVNKELGTHDAPVQATDSKTIEGGIKKLSARIEDLEVKAKHEGELKGTEEANKHTADMINMLRDHAFKNHKALIPEVKEDASNLGQVLSDINDLVGEIPADVFSKEIEIKAGEKKNLMEYLEGLKAALVEVSQNSNVQKGRVETALDRQGLELK